MHSIEKLLDRFIKFEKCYFEKSFYMSAFETVFRRINFAKRLLKITVASILTDQEKTNHIVRKSDHK